MYTKVTQSQLSSNGDKHQMSGVGSNSPMDYYQQESEDAEKNYSLLGTEESA